MSNFIQALGTLIRTGQLGQTGWVWDERKQLYDLWTGYFDNSVYDRTAEGGQRDLINASLGNAWSSDLAGLYNPVSEVVDLYLHIFGGSFGDEIRAESQNAAVLPALAQVWEWSNINIEKRRICRMPATYGLCGLRIVARDAPAPANRRVYIRAEHPNTIRDMILDDRGNVETIQLEYDITAGLAEDAETLTIRELLEKDRIRTWRVNGSIVQPFDIGGFIADGMPVSEINAYARVEGADYPNALGVTPYVICYHDQGNDEWGRNCFYKARVAIDRYNSLISHTDIQIHEHVRATWLVAASGAAPEEFDFSGRKVIYVDQRQGGTPPMVQALVANLDLNGAIAQSKVQLDAIEDKLPELKATAGRFLSGQSGETVAELRKPAEEKIQAARDLSEDALVRAQKIALSWGILLELFDLGTGMGTREAADRAFREGREDHKFNKRPLLTAEHPANGSQAAASTPAGFKVGDRVRVRPGMEHGVGMTGGATIELIDTPAIGIRLDVMPETVHKWYVASELEPEAGAMAMPMEQEGA